MKKPIYTRAMIVSISAMLLHMAWPAAAFAAGEPSALPPVLITEVQAGSGTSASEEFIELFNTTAAPIDLGAHSWQLQIASSGAASWDSPLRTVLLSGVLAPGGSYIAASQYNNSGAQVQYLPQAAKVWFSAGLTAAAGHVRLAYETYQPAGNACALAVTTVDQVEWSAPKNGAAATPSIDNRDVFVTEKSSGLASANSLQRVRDSVSQQYRDSGSDAADFAMSPSPGPGELNTLLTEDAAPAPGEPAAALPEDGCDPNPPVPDPTEDDDSGEDPTAQEPDPDESVPDPADTSDDEGQPADTPTIPAANQALQPPRLTELLPNPGSPQTDAADEFIELYNPNAAAFNLSGYVLEVGATTKHRYTIPEGTVIKPMAYLAFYSAATGLSMSNSGGQARLFDPLDTLLAAADPYGAAKDNQAWAFVQNKWQWTTAPTPNAANTLTAPQAKAAKTAKTAKAATKKTAAKKSSTTKAKKTAASGTASTTLAAEQTAARSPIHPGVLAVIGVFAVLYGAYEYRQDMANYVRRLREHRAHRRKNRQKPAGRGGD